MDSMTIIDLVRQQVAAERKERFQRSDQLSLGKLIEELALQDPAESIRYDFGYMVPTTLRSWRGSYDELALGYTEDDEHRAAQRTVGALLTHCREAVGKTFEGWKGGDFVMGLETPVWVANPGDGCNTAIIGVDDIDYQVVIQTAYMAF